MKAVVADTGPVNYLLLIGEINLLPCLFDEVLIPIEVHQELLNQNAPEVVRTWAANLPGWCSVKPRHAKIVPSCSHSISVSVLQSSSLCNLVCLQS
jgi:predicted nucleic acid-binding protein